VIQQSAKQMQGDKELSGWRERRKMKVICTAGIPSLRLVQMTLVAL
jgi:hypothetical protein